MKALLFILDGNLSWNPVHIRTLQKPAGAELGVVKPPLMLAFHMGAGLSSGCSTSCPACVGDLSEAPIPVVGPGWGVSHWMEELFL